MRQQALRGAILLGVAGALLCVLFAVPARAGTASKEFVRLWQEAGADETKKAEVVGRLAAEHSPEAARLLLGVALAPAEPASIADRAIQALAEQEATPADGWIMDELRKGARWADRAILARAVGRRRSPAAAQVLRDLLPDKHWQVTAAAVESLRLHRTRETVESLLALWIGLDPKREETARLSADVRDALLLIVAKDFETAADAQSWWSEKGAAWKPDAKERAAIEEKESVTQERMPRLFDEVRSRRALIVLDTSASMRVETGVQKDPVKAPNGLSRFEIMRREVRRVIDELPPSATFGLLAFGTKVQGWKPQLLPASDANKRGAGRFIDALKPDGDTNSYGALEEAFKNPDADTVYFLSDGYPTVGKTDFNAILAEVKRWNATRNLRIHSIAFVAGNGKPLGIAEGDKSMPKEFMRRLALENGGRYKLVE